MTRIVIADDEPFFAEALADLLETIPGRSVVGIATTARDAIELVRDRRPDVLLLDFRLPDADGASVARELRRLEISVRIVILTANSSTLVREECLRAGANTVLSKHLGLDAISEVLTVAA